MRCKQLACLDFKGRCQLLDDGNGWITFSALDVTDVCAVDASPVGVVLLAPAFRFAKPTHISTEALTDVHRSPRTPLSPIVLQTISHNRVDFVRPASICFVTYNRHRGCR